MNFGNLESLDSVKRVINEAETALDNPDKGLDTSAMKEVLGAFLGGGVGGAASFVARYALGTAGLSAVGITSGLAAAGALVGGGIVTGIFVLAAPIAALATGGALALSWRNKKKLKEAKQIILREAIAKQNAMIKALLEEAQKDKSRIDYLTSINNALTMAIKDLREDLNMAA